MIGLLVRAARDFWTESLLLMVFNLLYAAASLPGLALLSYAGARRDLALGTVAVGALALWPFASLALFGVAAEAVAGRSVNLRTFFRKGRQTLGLGYRWGALCLFVLVVLLANAAFYLDPRAPLGGGDLAGFLAALFLLLTVLWAALQAPLLAAVSVRPGSSLRQGFRAVGRAFLLRPLLLVIVALTCLLFFAAGVAILPLGLLLAFAWAAVLACRAMTDILPSTGPSVETGSLSKDPV